MCGQIGANPIRTPRWIGQMVFKLLATFCLNIANIVESSFFQQIPFACLLHTELFNTREEAVNNALLELTIWWGMKTLNHQTNKNLS
jgi:hypothetical protein